MDDLKKGMEYQIDGIEEKMKDNMEDMKNDLMEGLTKLIQDLIPNVMKPTPKIEEKRVKFLRNKHL